MKPIWFAATLALLLILLSFSCKKEALTCVNPEEVTDCFDPTLVDSLALCTADYSPVCGCDGNTYSNACHAETSGLKAWKSGECCE